MFASRFNLFFLPARKLGLFLRRRPKISLAAGLGLLLLLSLGGGYCWSQYHFWAAQGAFGLDLLPDASRHIELYLHLRPHDLDGHFLATRIDRLLGRYAEAEKHLQECQRIGGTTDRTRLEWFFLRAQGGQFSACEKGLHNYLENGQKDQTVLTLETLTLCYMQDLQFLAAQTCLEKWLNEEPDSVRALGWRGGVREKLGSIEEAKQDYQRVLELSPQHRTRLDLILVLIAENNIPQAAEHLEILEQAQTGNPAVIYALALCRRAQGQLEAAKKYLDRLLAAQPDNARALYQRGQLEREPGAKEKWLRKALKTDPSFQEASFSLYTSLQQQGKSDAKALGKKYIEFVDAWTGLEGLMKDLEKTPQNPDLLAKVGNALLARDPRVGRDFLHKALEISPYHRLANESLARFYEGKNQLDKAAQHRTRLSRPSGALK